MTSKHDDTPNLKPDSKAHRYMELVKARGGLDEDGVGPRIEEAALKEAGLLTSNGGDWSRSDGPLGKHYILDRIKGIDSSGTRRTIAVQILGRRYGAGKRPAPSWIRKLKKAEPEYRGACPVTGTTADELDHGLGREDDEAFSQLDKDPKYWQWLSKSANDAKRRHCQICIVKNERFDARNLRFKKGWIVGNEEWKGTCNGCYWRDPRKFHEKSGNTPASPNPQRSDED